MWRGLGLHFIRPGVWNGEVFLAGPLFFTLFVPLRWWIDLRSAKMPQKSHDFDRNTLRLWTVKKIVCKTIVTTGVGNCALSETHFLIRLFFSKQFYFRTVAQKSKIKVGQPHFGKNKNKFVFVSWVTRFSPGVTRFPLGVTTFPPGVTRFPPGVTRFALGVTRFALGVTRFPLGVARTGLNIVGCPEVPHFAPDTCPQGQV